MAKGEASDGVVLPAGREALTDVRFQAGGVHWGGARIVTHMTTDQSRQSITGSHLLIVDGLWLHPAGVLVRLGEGKFVIPHARVEVYTLA